MIFVQQAFLDIDIAIMKFPLVVRGLLLSAVVLGCTTCAVSQPIQDTLPGSATPAAVIAPHQFACGGAVEERIWKLWDAQGRFFLRQQLLGARLKEQGDAYALYDIQNEFHNLMMMALRCGRVDRLVQLADDLMPVFDALDSLNGDATNPAWICRGGSVCNTRNRLVNTEVMLVSAQGLGLFTALAEALAQAPTSTAYNHPFVARTVQVAVAHLLRWGNTKERARWMQQAGASTEDVKDGSSALFFTDKPLWQLGIHAHLAGIAAVQPETLRTVVPQGSAPHAELTQGMATLLHLFKQRLSMQTVNSSRLGGGGGQIADLDAGYWRLFADNSYAGYSGGQRPAVCEPAPGGGMRARVVVDAASVPSVEDLGWDFSHARRLVQVLDALHRNRQALLTWYGLSSRDLPAPDLAQAFAAQLVTRVWNGDVQYPLFTNYWGGANGWYRVAYNNGTGACYAGYPPFGLSNSFPTGGYAIWGRYYPVIDDLARSIYGLAESADPVAVAFIRQYYDGLSAAASSNNRLVTQLMFWPTLVR